MTDHTCHHGCACHTGGRHAPDFEVTDHAYDALLDEMACEDPEHRTRGLYASPSRYIASKLRADQHDTLNT